MVYDNKPLKDSFSPFTFSIGKEALVDDVQGLGRMIS